MPDYRIERPLPAGLKPARILVGSLQFHSLPGTELPKFKVDVFKNWARIAWEDAGPQFVREFSGRSKVELKFARLEGDDSRTLGEVAPDTRSHLQLMRKHTADLLFVPIIDFSDVVYRNVEVGRGYYCPEQPHADILFKYAVIDREGAIVGWVDRDEHAAKTALYEFRILGYRCGNVPRDYNKLEIGLSLSRVAASVLKAYAGAD